VCLCKLRPATHSRFERDVIMANMGPTGDGAASVAGSDSRS
jgi:hypothetical protein